MRKLDRCRYRAAEERRRSGIPYAIGEPPTRRDRAPQAARQSEIGQIKIREQHGLAVRARQRVFLVLALAPLWMAATVRREPPVSPTVTRWMKSLSLREKVAQLVVIPFSGFASQSRTPEHRKCVHLIRDVRVGGLILVNIERGRLVQRPDPYALAVYLNRLQKMARLPLLVSGDFERGASMRVNGVTVFPHAMAFAAAGDPALTRAEGQVTARESRALGFQWVFYPDADVNDNPDNPIINIRSFGENPETVAAHAVAFIEGAQSNQGGPG